MTAKNQGLRVPDFVVPTHELGVVIYADDKAVGLQFVDQNGDQAFLWVPGKLLHAIAKVIPDMFEKHPEALDWTPPDEPARKH